MDLMMLLDCDSPYGELDLRFHSANHLNISPCQIYKNVFFGCLRDGNELDEYRQSNLLYECRKLFQSSKSILNNLFLYAMMFLQSKLQIHISYLRHPYTLLRQGLNELFCPFQNEENENFISKVVLELFHP